MHRNVIYRDGKDLADQVVPISSYDTDDPEDLWAWMAGLRGATGGQAAGDPARRQPLQRADVRRHHAVGRAADADYAERRMRWEPLYEITQIKGDGETHPMLSADDEFADYGTWDKGSFGPEPKTPDMLPSEYARGAWSAASPTRKSSACQPVQVRRRRLHRCAHGLSTAGEDNFFGKVALVEPTADPIRFEEAITGRATPDDPSDDLTHADALASGLAAVWARENTREALWDALKRKEVYATTGTRIRVRVFGGFDFAEADMERSDFAAHGYQAACRWAAI
jgi:hypothetical protein